MKKFFFLAFILITTLCFGQKDSLNFIIEYLPNKTYTKEKNESTTIEMRYLGSKEVLENIKAQGIKNPQIIQEKEVGSYITTTGNKSENNFPISLKVSSNSNSNLKDLIFEGYCKEQDYPVFTSIKSSNFNAEQEKQLLQSMQSLFRQIPVINKKLKIGDNFSFSIPLKLPLGGINIETSINTNYTLKEIKNNNAFFDYTQTYIIKMNENKMNITGKGKSKGQSVYDITNHFEIYKKGETEIEMSSKTGDMQIQFRMQVNSEEKTNIN